MEYLHRQIEALIQQTLQRGKSVLLLGARQTGKTTLLKHQLKPDLFLSLADLTTQLAFEKQPDRLTQEIAALNLSGLNKKPPLIVIDEIQKNPRLMDGVQYLIDNQQGQFVITGSSARKLKRHSNINLLPGRVVNLQLDPLCLEELPTGLSLERILLYGTLPNLVLEENEQNRQFDLTSYVTNYLQEEIRAEAIVRQLGSFAKFLECAALSAGLPINLSKLSQDIGISRITLYEYFQILEDCLIATRIDALSKSNTRRRLTKAPKYMFFDTGIRRECSHFGTKISEIIYGNFFEEFIGNELLRWIHLHYPQGRLFYWRDHSGPEIDYIFETERGYLPIEVKWTHSPNKNDCRFLEKFLAEYNCLSHAYLVCQVPRKLLLSSRVIALPWHEFAQQLHNDLS